MAAKSLVDMDVSPGECKILRLGLYPNRSVLVLATQPCWRNFASLIE
jgi:hypothetical protein